MLNNGSKALWVWVRVVCVNIAVACCCSVLFGFRN